MAAVRLIAQETTGLGLFDQFGCRHDVVAIPLGNPESERKPKGVDDEVDLRGQTTARPTDRVRLGPRFPPATR